jgi:glucose/arabinose dehydrogenase
MRRGRGMAVLCTQLSWSPGTRPVTLSSTATKHVAAARRRASEKRRSAIARACIVLCCVILGAWDSSTLAPPSVQSDEVETISGPAHLVWTQRAAGSAEIAAIGYALYVDDNRTVLSNAGCARIPGLGEFYCTAALPALAVGAHTLQLASFFADGSVRESPRSEALRVNVVATAASAAARSTSIVEFGNGGAYRLETLADDVDDPIDIAVAPDGRAFVAERGGRIRVIPGGTEALAADAELLAIALDPHFERTHFVFAIFTAMSGRGDRTFVLARFREASGTFGDRAILLDNIAAAVGDVAALRFGPDGALYAAFGSGANDAAESNHASPLGKVLRINADGSTPRDQAGGSPLFAAGFQSPRGMAWRQGSSTLWVAERRGTLTAVDMESDADERNKRGVTRRPYVLPDSINPSSIAFVGDDLLVAAAPRRELLKIRFDPQTPLTVAGTTSLLEERVGAIRAVTTTPDGAVYIATDRAAVRLSALPAVR